MAVLNIRDGEFYGRGVNLAVISIVFTSAAASLVLSRLASRLTTGRKLGLDDYAIVASLVFSIGVGVSNCLAVEYGSGKRSADLSPHELHMALQCFWATQITYKFTINLTKTSICLLYLRIFSTADKARFRRTVYIVMAYVLLYAVASIIATIFECTPIPRIWNKKIPGTCINLTAFWYANAAANILGDICIFLLPLPVIRSLNLPSREKLGLTMVFCLGFFVCITSILRMTTLETGSKADDQTFGVLSSTIWTTVECNTGIICACLPMLKKPLAILFPRIFPRASNYAQYRESNSPPRRMSISPPTAINGWYGSQANKQPSMTISSGSTATANGGPGKKSIDASSDDTFVMGHQDVPLGHITKTTSVNVQYADERCLPALSPNNKAHTRSVSNLVGRDFSYP